MDFFFWNRHSLCPISSEGRRSLQSRLFKTWGEGGRKSESSWTRRGRSRRRSSHPPIPFHSTPLPIHFSRPCRFSPEDAEPTNSLLFLWGFDGDLGRGGAWVARPLGQSRALHFLQHFQQPARLVEFLLQLVHLRATRKSGWTRLTRLTRLTGWAGWTRRTGLTRWAGRAGWAVWTRRTRWTGLTRLTRWTRWTGLTGWSGRSAETCSWVRWPDGGSISLTISLLWSAAFQEAHHCPILIYATNTNELLV